MESFTSHRLDAGPTFVWAARVRGSGDATATAYARTHSFTVNRQASFGATDPHLSAVEYLLAAFGADLVCGLTALAAKRRLTIHAVEASVTGRLNNPLVALGCIGEVGDPGLDEIRGVVHVSADADADELEKVWLEVLARSPLFQTLQRAAACSVELRVTL